MKEPNVNVKLFIKLKLEHTNAPDGWYWVFTTQGAEVRLADESMYFGDRVTAIRAAERQRLHVTEDGNVHSEFL